jgi:rhodanese-related sulfurtransferase
MKTIRFIAFYAALVLVMVNCQAQETKKISVDGFEQKLNSTPDKIILDVRTPEEYAEGHLKNSVLIDYYRDDFKQQLAKLDKNKTVFVYCRSGKRSGAATELLTELGFKNVYDLTGGFTAWSEANKSVEK